MSVCDIYEISPMEPQPLYTAREGGGGELRRMRVCVSEVAGGTHKLRRPRRTRKGGGPDRPRPIRPHTSAAHIDQRHARRDGRARPRTSNIVPALGHVIRDCPQLRAARACTRAIASRRTLVRFRRRAGGGAVRPGPDAALAGAAVCPSALLSTPGQRPHPRLVPT